MNICHAGSRSRWGELAGAGGVEGRPCRAVRFVQAAERGEYGLTSLIVPKVSTSRRTTQGCAIPIWSVVNVGLCLPYLLITVGWHGHHGWLCRCWPNRPLVFWVKRSGEKKERPVAVSQNSSSSHREECRSDWVCPHYRAFGFCWHCEVELASVLINLLSNITTPGSAVQSWLRIRPRRDSTEPDGILWCQLYGRPRRRRGWSWHLSNTSGHRLPLRLSDWGHTYIISLLANTLSAVRAVVNKHDTHRCEGKRSLLDVSRCLLLCPNTEPPKSSSWRAAHLRRICL